MADLKIGDKTYPVASKAHAVEVIKALSLAKDKGKMLETMIASVEAGAMSWDAWTTVARSFQTMPKRAAVEGGWRSVFLEKHPDQKSNIEKVEGLVEALDTLADGTRVEGEKDGKKVAGKLTYRIVVNFVADSEKKSAPATAPVQTAPATTGGKRK